MQSPPNDDLVVYKPADSAAVTPGETPHQLLLHASSQGDIAWVQELLSQGASVSARSKDGKTPLICASIRGHNAVATLLLHHGADANAVDQDGMTALHHAASKAHVQVVELLLQNKAKLHLTCQLGRTAMHLAASCGSREAVQLLLNAGAWVGPQDELGWRPLHHAAWKGNAEVVELLLARGASPADADKLGRTAAGVGRAEDVQLLLSTAQEAKEQHKWRDLALRVVAGEAVNLLLCAMAGGTPLNTPQGRYYLGWLVRQADWQRSQSMPNLKLAVPQLPINCLEVAKRLPGLTVDNVLKKANVQELMHDGCFRDGVAVFDHQMRDMRQLLALPNAPITWKAVAAGKVLPARVLAPPALWQPPRRGIAPVAIIKWMVVRALRRGSGHLLLSALLLAASFCPPDALQKIRLMVQEQTRHMVIFAQDVHGKVVAKLKGHNVVEVAAEETDPSTSGAPQTAAP